MFLRGRDRRGEKPRRACPLSIMRLSGTQPLRMLLYSALSGNRSDNHEYSADHRRRPRQWGGEGQSPYLSSSQGLVVRRLKQTRITSAKYASPLSGSTAQSTSLHCSCASRMLSPRPFPTKRDACGQCEPQRLKRRVRIDRGDRQAPCELAARLCYECLAKDVL